MNSHAPPRQYRHTGIENDMWLNMRSNGSIAGGKIGLCGASASGGHGSSA